MSCLNADGLRARKTRSFAIFVFAEQRLLKLYASALTCFACLFTASLMKRVRSESVVAATALGSGAPAVAQALLMSQDLRSDTSHRTEFMRGFDLPFDRALDFRVYVLRCAQPGQLSVRAYYVGFALKGDLLDRLCKHFDQHEDSAAFTKTNKPLGVEFLWPARNRAAEAYLFYFLAEKFDKEDSVLKHVLVGGWTQTAAKPLGATDYNRVQREYRMLKGRCLECGRAGHLARRCPTLLAKASAAKSSSDALLGARAGVAAAKPKAALPVLHVVKAAAAPLAKASAVPKSAPAAVAVDWEQRAEAWLVRKRLVFDSSGWTLFKQVLISLELPWKNPIRYLKAESDVPKLLWKLGRRQPRDGSDFKRGSAKRGGNGPFYVRRAFLKHVLVERYRRKL